MLRSSLSLALLGTLGTAAIAGLAATLLLDLSTLEGMLLGSIVAATDGAAIFGVLRGSTLRRRLARTLEGEAGFNDPVAILLVLGFIEWIQQPDYGARRHGWCCSGASSGSASLVGLAVGWLGLQALRRARLGTAGRLPAGDDGDRGDRLRRRRHAARLRLSRRLPGRPVAWAAPPSPPSRR